MSLELILGLGIPILLIGLGKFIGSAIERKHFIDIAEREARFRGQPALSIKTCDAPYPVRSAQLASGSSRWTTSSASSAGFGCWSEARCDPTRASSIAGGAKPSFA